MSSTVIHQRTTIRALRTTSAQHLYNTHSSCPVSECSALPHIHDPTVAVEEHIHENIFKEEAKREQQGKGCQWAWKRQGV